MRMIFGLVSLLLVVAVIGILAKKQLNSVASLPAVPQTATGSASSASPTATVPSNVREQSQQMPQQVRDQIGQAMEAAAAARAQVDPK